VSKGKSKEFSIRGSYSIVFYLLVELCHTVFFFPLAIAILNPDKTIDDPQLQIPNSNANANANANAKKNPLQPGQLSSILG